MNSLNHRIRRRNGKKINDTTLLIFISLVRQATEWNVAIFFFVYRKSVGGECKIEFHRNNIKRIGPRTDPWDTPLFTGNFDCRAVRISGCILSSRLVVYKLGGSGNNKISSDPLLERMTPNSTWIFTTTALSNLYSILQIKLKMETFSLFGF